MSDNHEERLERVIRDLLGGRRLKIGPRDAPERGAVMAAARLAGQRERYPRMSPAFRKQLQRRLRADEPARRRLSRRDALVAGVAAVAGAAGAGAIARVEGLMGAPVRGGSTGRAPLATVYSTSDITPSNGTWFDAGPLMALPEGQAVHFRAGAVSAVLFREGDQVRGLSAICTHLPCELSWNGSARTLDCPCHNRSFDAQGRSGGDPYDYPLPPLPRVSVKVVDGHVKVLGA